MRSLFVSGIIVLASVAPALAGNWNSNEVAYWYGDDFREPGVSKGGLAEQIPKNIVTVTHVDGIGFLENFINIDVLKSTSGDPAESSSFGATEVYVVDRQSLSMNKMLETKAFAYYPVKDVELVAGIDVNTKDTAFAPFKRMPVAGMALSFDVPGFWKVAALWDKEWNYNGITNTRVNYDSTYRFETAWDIPFAISAANFTFEGYGVLNGAKGIDGFGDKTKDELLIHSQVMLDVGSWFDHPKLLKISAGYEYWLNKFGANNTTTRGAFAQTPFVRVSTVFSF